MLSAQAYSFRLKSRLAISLSWVAGYTNVILLITCGETVSHMTGNSTHLGNAAADVLLRRPGAAGEIKFFAFVVGLFFLGATTARW